MHSLEELAITIKEKDAGVWVPAQCLNIMACPAINSGYQEYHHHHPRSIAHELGITGMAIGDALHILRYTRQTESVLWITKRECMACRTKPWS